MADNFTPIAGLPIDGFVDKQIKARQDLLGNKNFSPSDLNYLNSNSAWIKMASSVFVTDEIVQNYINPGSEKNRLQLLDLDQEINSGTNLARRFVLFNGTGIDGNRAGVRTTNSETDIFGNYAYGFGGNEFGPSPMPGIISFETQNVTYGSTRKSTIRLKAFNKKQFDVIDLLYLRLGYTLIIEFGHSKYLDTENEAYQPENPVFANNNFSIIDEFWFKDNAIEIKNNEQQTLNFNGIHQEIIKRRKQSGGNYDAVIGVVENFNWTFDKTGAYDIEIQLISFGGVIESLRANPTDLNSPVVQNTSRDNASPRLNSNFTDILGIYLNNIRIISEYMDLIFTKRGVIENTKPLDQIIFDRRSNSPISDLDIESETVSEEIIKLRERRQELFDIQRKGRSNVDNPFGGGEFSGLTVSDRLTAEEEKELKQINEILTPSEKTGKYSLTELLNRLRKKTIPNLNTEEELSKINFEKFLGWFDSKTYLDSLNINSGEKKNKIAKLTSSFLSFVGLAEEDAVGSIIPWIALLNNISFDSAGNPKVNEEILRRQEEAFASGEEITDLERLSLDTKSFPLLEFFGLYDSVDRVWDGEEFKSYKDASGELKPKNIVKLYWDGDDQNGMYIRFGFLLEFLNNKVLPKFTGLNIDNDSIIKIGYEKFKSQEEIAELKEEGNENPIIESEDYCFTFDGQFSADPSVCVVGNYNIGKLFNAVLKRNNTVNNLGNDLDYRSLSKIITGKLYNGFSKNYVDSVGTETLIGDVGLDPYQESPITETGENPQSPVGKIKNIYINFNFIEKVLSNRTTDGKVDLYSFLASICDGINESLGGVNNLFPVVDSDTNILRIVDQTPINDRKNIEKQEQSTALNVYGFSGDGSTGNFVEEFQFNTTIDKSLQNVLAIGAQSQGVGYNQDTSAGAFTQWNTGLVDRTKPRTSMDRSNSIVSAASSSLDRLVEEQEALIVNSSKAIFSFLIDQSQAEVGDLSSFWSTLSPSGVNPDINGTLVVGQENLLKTYYKAFIEKANINVTYTSYNLNGFLPIGFGLTVNGISGPKFYNRLKVVSEYLPKVYPNQLDYIITGIKHTIENNKWLTIYDLLFYTKSGPYILEEDIDPELLESLRPDIEQFPAFALPNVGENFLHASIPADIFSGASIINVDANLNQAVFAANDGFNVYEAGGTLGNENYSRTEVYDSLDSDVRSKFRKIVDSIEQMMVEAKLQRPNVKLVQGFRNVNTQNEKTEDGASTLNFGYHNLVKEVNGKIKPASRALDLIWNNAELGSYTKTNNNIEFWIRVGLLLEKERFEPILGKSFIKIEQNSSTGVYRFVNKFPSAFQWGGAWYNAGKPLGKLEIDGKTYEVGWDPYHFQYGGRIGSNFSSKLKANQNKFYGIS